MTMQGSTAVSAEPVALDYERTVERSLVHKAAVSEVFVTDVRATASRTVSTAVQLPLIHGYYSDHLQHPAVYDALLLLEAGRQSAIAGSHSHIGLPEGTTMIVDRFGFTLDSLKPLTVGPVAGRLRIDTEYIGKPGRNGKYRKGKVVQRFHVQDGPGGQFAEVGEHTMEVLFLNPHENGALRRVQRGTPAPLTSEYEGGPAGGPGRVEPERVGRAHASNVVLSGVAADGDLVTAEVAPDFGNRALFDHVYDHLPAMTLVEAARQLALIAAEKPTSAYITGVQAHFARFAELDETVRVSTVRPGPADENGRFDVPVVFHQGEAEVATVRLTLGTLS